LLGSFADTELKKDLYDEGAFGSAFAEFRGAKGLLRLVWDGKERALRAEIAREGDWIDVEQLAAGAETPLPIDREQTDARVERLLRAIQTVWLEPR
jgi:hypothetical protein